MQPQSWLQTFPKNGGTFKIIILHLVWEALIQYILSGEQEMRASYLKLVFWEVENGRQALWILALFIDSWQKYCSNSSLFVCNKFVSTTSYPDSTNIRVE